jgi:hypothetical protein
MLPSRCCREITAITYAVGLFATAGCAFGVVFGGLFGAAFGVAFGVIGGALVVGDGDVEAVPSTVVAVARSEEPVPAKK